MKQTLQKISAVLIGAGITTLDFLYRLVPDNKAYDWGAALARALYPCFPNRRRIAIDNILATGVATTRAEADRIARQAFGHMAGHICEALKVSHVITKDNWLEHLTFECPDDMRRLLTEATDEPIFIFSSHHGVWEAAVNVLSFARPMIAIARKMNNPYVEEYTRHLHFRGAITIIDKNQGFTPSVIKQWKRTAAALTIVMDQHAGTHHGVKVDFMGVPAWTHTSPARLGLKMGYRAIVGSFVRTGPFQYLCLSKEPIYNFTLTGDMEADIRRTLVDLNTRLEYPIRRYPEQYLWAHRRWRA